MLLLWRASYQYTLCYNVDRSWLAVSCTCLWWLIRHFCATEWEINHMRIKGHATVMRFLESSGLSHIGIPDTKGKINCWTSCTLHLRKKYSTHWIQGRHFASTLQLSSVRRAQTKESYLTDLGSLNINVCISCSVMFDSLWLHGPPGSYVHEIFQARTPEWVAIPFSRGCSWRRDQTQVSCTPGSFIVWATGEVL